MTPKQTSLYWREWHAAKTAGQLEEEDRHHIHRKALSGNPHSAISAIRNPQFSSKLFTNEELDLVLAAFRAISQPDSLNAQLRALNQPRQRLLYGIKGACSVEYRMPLLRTNSVPPTWSGSAWSSFGNSS